MSGFAGLVATSGRSADAVVLQRMAGELAFRGPDGRGVWTDGPVGLAHALLGRGGRGARERQPLSLDGRVWVVADARIDGQADLLHELRAKGRVPPPDATDSELVLHAYLAWGDDCVDHLLGDFAFAVWDAPRRRLFCARDHFGVVPFHYARVDGALVFGNTLAAVRAHPAVGGALDRRTVGDYLLFGYSADPAAGFFEAVRRLPAAHAMTLEGGTLRLRRYWTVPEPDDSPPRMSDAERVERFRDLLGRAVDDRARDGPLAVAMSGGMDSTAVCALAARGAGASAGLQAYCVGFDWLVPDVERYWAGLAARRIGVPFRALAGEGYFLGARPDEIWRRVPEPRFELRRGPGSQLLAQATADGCRSVLTGFGGDVLVAARNARWAQLLAHGRLGRFAADAWAYRRRFGHRPALRASVRSHLAGPISVPIAAPLEPDFVREMQLQERADAVIGSYRGTDPRRGMALHNFWSELLSAQDPESTGVPVRMRHPFFDLRLLEEALRTPPVPWLTRKTLLRDASVGLVPDELIERPKSPLGTDPYWSAAARGHEPWLRGLADAHELDGFVDRGRLRRIVDDVERSGPGSYLPQVLIPASLVAWLRQRSPASRGTLSPVSPAGRPARPAVPL